MHSDDGLEAYLSDLMAQVVLGTSKPQDLDASRERVSEQNAAILLTRVVKVGGRIIGELVTVFKYLELDDSFPSALCNEELHAGNIACPGGGQFCRLVCQSKA